MEAGVRKEGLEAFCSGVRYLKMPVLDIPKDPEKTQEALSQLCKISIEEDGADVIVLGCTGLSHEIDLEPIMLNLGIPILDPWVVAVKTAFMLVESGLTHSKVAYPFPPKKKIKRMSYSVDEFRSFLRSGMIPIRTTIDRIIHIRYGSSPLKSANHPPRIGPTNNPTPPIDSTNPAYAPFSTLVAETMR